MKNIYAPIKRTLSSEAFLLQARRSGRDFTRERALPLQRLVPLLLNFRKGTNRDELDQFFETITDDPASVTPVSEAAFCRARQKLKPEALVTLNNVLLDSTNSTLSYFRLPPEASSQGVLSSSVSFMNDAGNTIWRWIRSW